MSSLDGHLTPSGTLTLTTDRRRLAIATIIGTSVEWYDFFTYAAAAGLVFGKLFFEPAGPAVATILAFTTVGISFLFRPLGAFLAGHFGDKIGRRPMLMLTLVLMGVGTTLIGLIPGYDTIGVSAPIILIFLRIVQGVSAGGEWGGAVLMAVEHAPRDRRGVFGAMPQIGVPIGLLLSSGVLAVMSAIFPGDSFYGWGWRIPFLLSFLLIIVGYWVRRRIEESPVFVELAARDDQPRVPVARLFARFTPLVLLAALVFAGDNGVGYMTTGGFVQNYATNPDGAVRLDRGPVLWIVALSGAVWLVSAFFAGWLTDRIGRRTVYLIGWVIQAAAVIALFPLVNLASLAGLTIGLVFLSLALGFTYGPQAAWYVELFPASIRYSGISISYAIGAILGGAFAPLIAQALLQATGSTMAITWYLLLLTAVAFVATLLLRERKGINLSPANEAEQEQGIYQWQKPAVQAGVK
ncbi:MFS transporter [Gryllotalpicola koreensis]|uniref:MFS transporter n=1 Tax=Gryllotalpicola koreensis TaxID=993086 RepID=A0ABP8A0W8_9MICO